MKKYLLIFVALLSSALANALNVSKPTEAYAVFHFYREKNPRNKISFWNDPGISIPWSIAKDKTWIFFPTKLEGTCKIDFNPDVLTYHFESISGDKAEFSVKLNKAQWGYDFRDAISFNPAETQDLEKNGMSCSLDGFFKEFTSVKITFFNYAKKD